MALIYNFQIILKILYILKLTLFSHRFLRLIAIITTTHFNFIYGLRHMKFMPMSGLINKGQEQKDESPDPSHFHTQFLCTRHCQWELCLFDIMRMFCSADHSGWTLAWTLSKVNNKQTRNFPTMSTYIKTQSFFKFYAQLKPFSTKFMSNFM